MHHPESFLQETSAVPEEEAAQWCLGVRIVTSDMAEFQIKVDVQHTLDFISSGKISNNLDCGCWIQIEMEIQTTWVGGSWV